MSAGSRPVVMRVLALCVVLWPLAHAALVARFEIDPWEFFGWAMYSQPAARVQVRVEVGRGGELEPLRAMGALRKEIERYARRRTALGRLASPRTLADTVFAADPSIETVEIVHRRIRLDQESAMLVSTDDVELFTDANRTDR